MKLNRIVLSVAASMLVGMPAYAAGDFSSVLKSFAGIVRNFDDLEARRVQLDGEINKGLNAGQINASEAAALKADLAQIADRAAQLKASGKRFGFTQQLLFTNDINLLNNRIGQAIAAKAGTAVNTPQNIDAAQLDIANKITAAQSAGKLNQADADKLQQGLKHVSDIRQAFLASSTDGNLTAKQFELINVELEKVRAAFEEQMKQSDSAVPQLNERRNNLGNKVSEAETARKISPDLAGQLRSEIQQVANMQAGFLADATLSGSEILKLASELDRMDSRIDQAIQTSAAVQQSTPLQPSTPTQPSIPPQTRPAGTQNIPPVSYNQNKYTDIQSYWAAPYVAILGERGVIGGFPNGSFKPNDPITRSQFAAIAVRALSLPQASGAANFQDVPAKHWANAAIAAVSASGLVTGFPDGSFRPEDKITRTQALVILAKALPGAQADKTALGSFTDAAAVPAWAYASVLKAADSGIIVNYPDATQIRPGDNATRGEVAALMYRTLQNLGQDLPFVTVGLPQYVIGRHGQQNLPPAAPPISAPATTVQTAPPAVQPAPPLTTTPVTTAPSTPVPEKIYLFNVNVQAPAQLRGGDLLTVSAIGTPKGKAALSIGNLLDKVPMQEIRDGVYECSYTVKRTDNLANAKVTVTLSKDNSAPASMDYAQLLILDAKAPEIGSIQPAANAVISDRQTSIIATFNDGTGSGVNLPLVKLLVNGVDMSKAATIDQGFVTYRPMQPIKEDAANIELTVPDKAGNTAVQNWTFRFDKPFQPSP